MYVITSIISCSALLDFMFCVYWSITNSKFVRCLWNLKGFWYLWHGEKWSWYIGHGWRTCQAWPYIWFCCFCEERTWSPHDSCLLQLAWCVSASEMVTVIQKAICLTTWTLVNILRAKTFNPYLFNRFSPEMETEQEIPSNEEVCWFPEGYVLNHYTAV